jgi:hypothetical protein
VGRAIRGGHVRRGRGRPDGAAGDRRHPGGGLPSRHPAARHTPQRRAHRFPRPGRDRGPRGRLRQLCLPGARRHAARRPAAGVAAGGTRAPGAPDAGDPRDHRPRMEPPGPSRGARPRRPCRATEAGGRRALLHVPAGHTARPRQEPHRHAPGGRHIRRARRARARATLGHGVRGGRRAPARDTLAGAAGAPALRPGLEAAATRCSTISRRIRSSPPSTRRRWPRSPGR